MILSQLIASNYGWGVDGEKLSIRVARWGVRRGARGHVIGAGLRSVRRTDLPVPPTWIRKTTFSGEYPRSSAVKGLTNRDRSLELAWAPDIDKLGVRRGCHVAPRFDGDPQSRQRRGWQACHGAGQ